MSTHITEKMGLNINSHSEIEYVDITLSPDTKLFLDPRLIESGTDSRSIKANQAISSYFDCFYDLYKQGASVSSKINLFQHAHEINATKLGYGSGHNGKAKTPEGMLNTFSTIDSLFHNGINLQYASDLPIFIQGFAEDCLSDMLTNILFGVLSDFTVEQCRKYNVKTRPIPNEYHFWDDSTQSWQVYSGNCLLVDGKVILLVPKHFVRQCYYFNTSQYFSRVILGKIQNDESWIGPNGKIIKPPKRDLAERYKGTLSIIECAVKFTRQKPSYLSEYHQLLPMIYIKQGMSDEKLDEIIYRAG